MKELFLNLSIIATWLLLWLTATNINTLIVLAIVTLFFLLSFYLSKSKSYLYAIVVMVILDYPGGFYWNTTTSVLKFGNFRLSLAELFSMVAVVKYGLHFNKHIVPFIKPYRLFFVVFVTAIVIGGFEGYVLSDTEGSGYGVLASLFRMILLYPLFLTMPRIYSSRYQVDRTIDLLGVIVIVNLLFQIYHIAIGRPIAYGFTGFGSIRDTAQLIRPVYGIYISFVLLIFSIFRIAQQKGRGPWSYIFVLLSYGSIFIGATRGWMLASSFVILASWFLVKGMKSSDLFRYYSLPLLLVLLLSQIGVVKNQVARSFDRFSTLELVLEGDVTAGGTNSRLTERHYPVISKFFEKPILGWGFSATGAGVYDVHVGNQSMLMASGLLGSFLIIFSIFWIAAIIGVGTRNYSTNESMRGYGVFVVSIGGLFIIHSTSTDLFSLMAISYGNNYSKAVFISIFLSMVSATMFKNLIKVPKVGRIS